MRKYEEANEEKTLIEMNPELTQVLKLAVRHISHWNCTPYVQVAEGKADYIN